MQWKGKNCKTVKEAIDGNTGGLSDAFLMRDNKQYAVQNADIMASWLMCYAKQNYPITIVGDYDVDGVCASAGLYLALQEVGATNVSIRLPKRMTEGYGLKESIIDEIPAGIVVTVDNGIAAEDAIRKAKQKGLIVLVIDHHLPVTRNNQIILPPADLIVNPSVPDELIYKSELISSDFHYYCGAGLVYKVSQYMIPNSDMLEKISAFAAIATIADVVPLLEDNRKIYWRGMMSIQKGMITAGLQAIIDLLKTGNYLTEESIGYAIAPMLNAPGRLYDDGANISLRAILTENYTQASVMANELKDINEDRKDIRNIAVDRAIKAIEKDALYNFNPIVIVDPETPEGIIGLVAGSIQEKYHSTAIVFTEKDDTLKGSARANDEDDIKAALDKLHDIKPDIFIGYGGHKAAAGISIKNSFLSEFKEGLYNILPPARPVTDIIEYDLEIEAGDLLNTIGEVQCYSPFGAANPEIIVRVNNFGIVPVKNTFYTELKNGSVKFYGANCTAIGFDMMEKYKAENYPKCMDFIGKLTYHYYMGRAYPQIDIIDLKASQTDVYEMSPLNASIASALKEFCLE